MTFVTTCTYTCRRWFAVPRYGEEEVKKRRRNDNCAPVPLWGLAQSFVQLWNTFPLPPWGTFPRFRDKLRHVLFGLTFCGGVGGGFLTTKNSNIGYKYSLDFLPLRAWYCFHPFLRLRARERRPLPTIPQGPQDGGGFWAGHEDL